MRCSARLVRCRRGARAWRASTPLRPPPSRLHWKSPTWGPLAPADERPETARPDPPLRAPCWARATKAGRLLVAEYPQGTLARLPQAELLGSSPRWLLALVLPTTSHGDAPSVGHERLGEAPDPPYADPQVASFHSAPEGTKSPKIEGQCARREPHLLTLVGAQAGSRRLEMRLQPPGSCATTLAGAPGTAVGCHYLHPVPTSRAGGAHPRVWARLVLTSQIKIVSGAVGRGPVGHWALGSDAEGEPRGRADCLTGSRFRDLRVPLAHLLRRRGRTRWILLMLGAQVAHLTQRQSLSCG